MDKDMEIAALLQRISHLRAALGGGWTQEGSGQARQALREDDLMVARTEKDKHELS